MAATLLQSTPAGAAAGECPNPDPFHRAIFPHLVASLPRLRAMRAEHRMRLMQECSQHSLENPLHLVGPKPMFTCATWGADALSGAEVMALFVAALWAHMREDERLASGLMSDWPELAAASRLADLAPAYEPTRMQQAGLPF